MPNFAYGSDEQCVEEIPEQEIPEQFRYPIVYMATDIAAASAAFMLWCRENKVYYYARPRESFYRHEAEELAIAAGCTRLILEDMS
jgi:hypothetical protein